MAGQYLPYNALSARFLSTGGKATSLLFANPGSSGYRFKVSLGGTGTPIVGSAKTSDELKNEWKNQKLGFTSKSPDEQYLDCMNLLADMRYAANYPAGIPGEIYNHINGLTVETTTYERLFFAYTELEKASGRA